MNSDVVNCFWMRDEFAEQRGDWQTNASLDLPGADLLQDDAAVSAMQQAPLTMPPSDFSVRSVYDSRPVNGYDFNFSAVTQATLVTNSTSAAVWFVNFNVPNGYRAVPRDWKIWLDPPAAPGPSSASTVSLTQNGAAVPNNQDIIIGNGTTDPIESFFVCEENTTFGVTGATTLIPRDNDPVNVNVNVHGNLIPVDANALPYAIANQETVTGS
jgi:hypothetical protein